MSLVLGQGVLNGLVLAYGLLISIVVAIHSGLGDPTRPQQLLVTVQRGLGIVEGSIRLVSLGLGLVYLLGPGGGQLVVVGLGALQTGLGLVQRGLQVAGLLRGQHLPGLDHVPEMYVAGLDVALALEGEGDALESDEVAGGADGHLDVPVGCLGGDITAHLFLGSQVAPAQITGGQHYQDRDDQGDAALDKQTREAFYGRPYPCENSL